MVIRLSKRLKQFESNFNEQNFGRFAACLSFMVILAAVIRASSAGLMYDEAVTYLWYARPENFLGGGQLLNNHWLNTFLIFILDIISGNRFNDFIIRLPNLIFLVFYCYGAYLISSKLRFKYLIFTLFLLNYYLFCLFCNARGYGIAASCMLLACYFLISFENTHAKGSFNFFIVFSCLAVLANGICIYSTITLLAVLLIRLHSISFIKEHLLPIVIQCSVCICMGIFLIYVTRTGYPVFSGGSTKFILSIGDSLFPERFFSILFSLCVALILIYSYFKGIRSSFTYACLLYVLVACLSNSIFGKNFPVERESLPFYPVVVCAIAQSIQELEWLKKISGVIVIFLMSIFLLQFFLPNYKDRIIVGRRHMAIPLILNNYSKQNEEIKNYLKKERDFTGSYYIEKYEYLKKHAQP